MYVKLQTHASYIVYLMDFIQLCLAFTGWETANKYKITNTQAQQVFFAAEGNMIIHVSPGFSLFLSSPYTTLPMATTKQACKHQGYK